ncbi:hypothetical protein M378DRAFT_165993 [Amanita muscaria Koide BX008]|uniref:Uncharacterized protein n=1 Tax=Amanita muscaria (strain Koide BX008) TaxID=946122 RepID=A0A0C2T6E7_AMAMK|nr:hypothetical protein M378DRAFT_165993 [Amanita muscaria Koide BX008]
MIVSAQLKIRQLAWCKERQTNIPVGQDKGIIAQNPDSSIRTDYVNECWKSTASTCGQSCM